MADHDGPKLEVPIIITSDPQGAKQAASAIKEVGEAAKGTVPEQAKLNESQKGAAEATSKLTGSKKELIDQLRVLQHQFPIVGELIHAVKNPYVSLAAAAGLAWGWLQKVNAELEAAEARVQKMELLNDSIGRFGARTFEANERMQQSIKSLVELIETGRGAKEMLGDLNELLQERLRLSAQAESGEKGAKFDEIERRRKAQHDAIDKSGVPDDVKKDAKTAADIKAAEEKAKVERQFLESERLRQRNADMERADAYESAAKGEADKAYKARFQLPGAIEATMKAQGEADDAEILASGTQADFEARSPAMLKRIRDAKTKVATAAGLTGEDAPPPPIPGPGGRAMSMSEWRSVWLQGQRDQAGKEFQDADDEYQALVRENKMSRQNLRVAKRKADDALGEEGGLRRTMNESTQRAIEFGETGEKIRGGVLRSALNDTLAERARPPGAMGDGASAAFAGAGQRMQEGAGQITRIFGGLDTAISELKTAIEQLGQGGKLQHIEQELRRLTQRVDLIASQGRTGGFSGR